MIVCGCASLAEGELPRAGLVLEWAEKRLGPIGERERAATRRASYSRLRPPASQRRAAHGCAARDQWP
eukprot:7059220-Alexandrium_andersonii.AAC.1